MSRYENPSRLRYLLHAFTRLHPVVSIVVWLLRLKRVQVEIIDITAFNLVTMWLCSLTVITMFIAFYTCSH